MSFLLELSKESSYTDRMKNKKYTNEELIQAATVMKDWYSLMAKKTKNAEMAKKFNEIRLEMRNLLITFEDINAL